jgi:hypothetical protein
MMMVVKKILMIYYDASMNKIEYYFLEVNKMFGWRDI